MTKLQFCVDITSPVHLISSSVQFCIWRVRQRFRTIHTCTSFFQIKTYETKNKKLNYLLIIIFRHFYISIYFLNSCLHCCCFSRCILQLNSSIWRISSGLLFSCDSCIFSAQVEAKIWRLIFMTAWSFPCGSLPLKEVGIEK